MRRKFQDLIAIIGDSWGCGEWNFVPGVVGVTITHTGLEQYLLDDDHKVINLSRGGNQNFESIESLEKYLQEVKLREKYSLTGSNSVLCILLQKISPP